MKIEVAGDRFHVELEDGDFPSDVRGTDTAIEAAVRRQLGAVDARVIWDGVAAVREAIAARDLAALGQAGWPTRSLAAFLADDAGLYGFEVKAAAVNYGTRVRYRAGCGFDAHRHLVGRILGRAGRGRWRIAWSDGVIGVKPEAVLEPAPAVRCHAGAAHTSAVERAAAGALCDPCFAAVERILVRLASNSRPLR